MSIKIKYQVFRISEMEVCTPSMDYYSRSGDWNSTSSTSLNPTSVSFDTESEAEEFLKDPQNGFIGDFVIVKIYEVS